jgi:outer membrane protein
MRITLRISYAVTMVAVVWWPLCAYAQSTLLPASPPVDARRLTIEEAVGMALENNLGIQAARIDPRVQDLAVAEARAAWFPTVTSVMDTFSADSPNSSFLSGGQGLKISDDRLSTSVGVGQMLPSGGTYNIGWNSSRATTTNLFSNFSPQIRSSLAFTYSQPLLRNFLMNGARQQVLISEKHRQIADVTLRQAVALTSRAVRHTYWNLAYAIAALQVHRQSLDLARQSLQDTRARVDAGTIPPIDIVEADAEVAQREEAVIVSEAQIATSEDALRALVFDSDAPDFWTLHINPVSMPSLQVTAMDVDAAVRVALMNRSDRQQSQRNLEAADINVRYFRNQTLPDVTARLDYGVTGLGGTQFLRGAGFPGPVIGQTERGFSDVLTDVFRNDFPNWTASLSVSYPIGRTPQDAALARVRLEYSQAQVQLRSQALQITTEVRDAARQVVTNERRVQTTRLSRELAEQRLEAEEQKFVTGTSTSFFVFQAQRDLAQARNNELRAMLDYSRSVVDFQTVQEAPLR